MYISSFIAGFATAVLCTICITAAAYVLLVRSRKRAANIKGYLDLIPDLSPEQRARVREIRNVFLPKVEEMRRGMRCLRAELAELLFEDPVDRERIYATTDRIVRSQSELEKEVIEHILEERELLSPCARQDVLRYHYKAVFVGWFGSSRFEAGVELPLL